jgi:uncharacterized short protein YbdD (DUF466 family)
VGESSSRPFLSLNFMFLKLVIDYVNGDFAYQNYLNHLKKYHPKEVALDKKAFLKKRQEDKWKRVNRCC